MKLVAAKQPHSHHEIYYITKNLHVHVSQLCPAEILKSLQRSILYIVICSAFFISVAPRAGFLFYDTVHVKPFLGLTLLPCIAGISFVKPA